MDVQTSVWARSNDDPDAMGTKPSQVNSQKSFADIIPIECKMMHLKLIGVRLLSNAV